MIISEKQFVIALNHLHDYFNILAQIGNDDNCKKVLKFYNELLEQQDSTIRKINDAEEGLKNE